MFCLIVLRLNWCSDDAGITLGRNDFVDFVLKTYAATNCLQVERLTLAKEHGCYDVIHCDESGESGFPIVKI